MHRSVGIRHLGILVTQGSRKIKYLGRGQVLRPHPTQVAGRVIRATSGRGMLHLIDERYGRAEVVRLLPGWWKTGQDGLRRTSRFIDGDSTQPAQKLPKLIPMPE